MTATDGIDAPDPTDHDDALAKKLARLPESKLTQYETHVQNTIDRNGFASPEYRHGLADTYLQGLSPHAENVQIQDHNWRETQRAHERGLDAGREPRGLSLQPDLQSAENSRAGSTPPDLDPMERVLPSGMPDYGTLQQTHDEVRDGTSRDEGSGERILARSNEESARRQQVEVAISTGGATPPDAPLTRDQIRAELKAIADTVTKRVSGQEHEHDATGRDAGAPPSTGRPGP